MNNERYARQTLLPEIGAGGQEKIRQARVLVIGAGGLGSPLLLYLAGAGVGTIGIVDNDRVSLSNLPRQILYATDQIGQSKAEMARQHLQANNPEVTVVAYDERLCEANAPDLINRYDLVVDACDNLPTRYLIDRVCGALQKPWVYGSICGFAGQLSVFRYREGPAYTDLYPLTENAGTFTQPAGVIGPLPGVIGALQATEVVKIILDHPDVLSGKLLLADILSCRFTVVRIKK